MKQTTLDPFEGPLMAIPKGRTELVRVYGDPGIVCDRDTGRVTVSRSWEYRCLTLARDFACGVRKLYVHRLMEPYLREGLRRAEAACPEYAIDTIGCFAPRFQRHDPSLEPSDHTWAIAVDINADRNRGRYRTKKTPIPKPFEPGWEKYSDIPEGFVLALESCGFEWGGRWHDFVDPMHFSLRRT